MNENELTEILESMIWTPETQTQSKKVVLVGKYRYGDEPLLTTTKVYQSHHP